PAARRHHGPGHDAELHGAHGHHEDGAWWALHPAEHRRWQVIRLGRSEKLWIAGGVLGAAALLAISWFVFISPQYVDANDLRRDRVDAVGRLTALEQRLAELRKQ